MLPISDDNPRHLTPWVSWTIIGLNILAFLWQLSLGSVGGERAIYALGFIPARFFGHAELPPELDGADPWATILTSMFLHGG